MPSNLRTKIFSENSMLESTLEFNFNAKQAAAYIEGCHMMLHYSSKHYFMFKFSTILYHKVHSQSLHVLQRKWPIKELQQKHITSLTVRRETLRMIIKQLEINLSNITGELCQVCDYHLAMRILYCNKI